MKKWSDDVQAAVSLVSAGLFFATKEPFVPIAGFLLCLVLGFWQGECQAASMLVEGIVYAVGVFVIAIATVYTSPSWVVPAAVVAVMVVSVIANWGSAFARFAKPSNGGKQNP